MILHSHPMQEMGIGRFFQCGRQTVTDLAFENGFLAVVAADNKNRFLCRLVFPLRARGDFDVFCANVASDRRRASCGNDR